MLDLARRIYPDIEAVFIDTGLEYPEIREFVKTFDNVTTLRPKMNFKEVIEKYGYPVISKDVSRRVSDVRKNGKKSYAYKMFQGEYTNLGHLYYIYNCRNILIKSKFKISN